MTAPKSQQDSWYEEGFLAGESGYTYDDCQYRRADKRRCWLQGHAAGVEIRRINLARRNQQPPDLSLTGRVALTALREQLETGTSRAYPAEPGTGPKGKTCRWCQQFTRQDGAPKCGRMKHKTTDNSTHISPLSPACKHWIRK